MIYAEVENNCDVCGSEKYKHIRSKNAFGTERKIVDGDKIYNATDVMCEACGLVYKRPMLSFESLQEFYRKEYIKLYNPGLEAGIPKIDIFHQSVDAIYMMEWAEKLGIVFEGKKILNVGSGLGVLSHFLDVYGARTCSIEPAERSCEISRKLFGVDVLNINFEDQFDNGPYDVLIFQNSLEHFYSAKKSLGRARKFIKNDGMLIIEVPDILMPYPRTILDAWLSSAHIYGYTKEVIELLLLRCGFEMKCCDHVGDKAKMLIMAVPTYNKFSMGNIHDGVENTYKLLFDIFREVDSMGIKNSDYQKELSENKDVIALGKRIFEELPFTSNIYLLAITETLNNQGLFGKAYDFINSMEYREGRPYDLGCHKGTYFFLKALLARQRGDMMSCKEFVDLSIETYPPIEKYNIIREMMINGILSESIMSRFHYYSAVQLKKSIT